MMIKWNERSVRWFHNASEFTGYNKKLAEIILNSIPSKKVCVTWAAARRLLILSWRSI